MKRVILSLGLVSSLILTNKLNAQIVVKKPTQDSVIWESKLTGVPKLIHFYGGEDNFDYYVLYYKNLEYQYINDIKYIDLLSKENTIEFFNLLKKVADEGGEEIIFEIDNNDWYVKRKTNLVYLSCLEAGSFWLTKNNIDKILENLNSK